MKIELAEAYGNFPRLIVPIGTRVLKEYLESDDATPFITKAVEIADECGAPVHLQNEDEYTIHIIYPE